MPHRAFLALLLVCLLLGPAVAAPADAKVGDVRSIFAKAGEVIREKPSALGGPVATLRYGTQVKVLELKKPWLRVQALSGGRESGWIQAWRTVEPSALGANAKPPHLKVTARKGTSASEVSAAGRQLDAKTERGFRASRKDLEAAYRAVDAMEAATQSLHPADALAFIDAGNLGRRGRDYARPGRIEPSQRRANQGSTTRRRRRGGGIGGALGGLVGRGLNEVGAPKEVGRVADAIISTATQLVDQVSKAFTPEQEYFIGRAVAAQVIARYGVDPSEARRRYVRLVGESVVRLTNRLPANIGGYHFEVLDSDEINGVSGPGGFVLITRGAVMACQNETELAGILGHELAHIRYKDGEAMLRKGGEFQGFVKTLGGAAAKATGNGDFARGLQQFLGQVSGRMGSIAMNQGYGRALERRADTEGTYLLYDVFYEPDGLQTLLSRMPAHAGHQGRNATHDSPQARAELLVPVVAKLPFNMPEKMLAPRKARFDAMKAR